MQLIGMCYPVCGMVLIKHLFLSERVVLEVAAEGLLTRNIMC